MDWQSRISSNPAVLSGKPVIKGTRISAELLVGWLSKGWTHAQILESYPHLVLDDIYAVLAFAESVLQEESVFVRYKLAA
jgi:uncharacterized protein (DUF433 family)